VLNKERFAKEIVEIAVDGWAVALKDGLPTTCAAIDCHDCDFYHKGCHDKRIAWGNSEYIEKSVDPGWAIDTKVSVSNDCKSWLKRYYAGFQPNYKDPYMTWIGGKTSWTSADSKIGFWKYAKLPEGE